jgi:inhibitor of KinA sporulation pathway (predicted exonuclease)
MKGNLHARDPRIFGLLSEKLATSELRDRHLDHFIQGFRPLCIPSATCYCRTETNVTQVDVTEITDSQWN